MTVTIFSDIKKRLYLVCHGALEIACYDVVSVVTVMPTHFDVQKRKYHPSTLASTCETHTGAPSLPASPQSGYRTTLCGE